MKPKMPKHTPPQWAAGQNVYGSWDIYNVNNRRVIATGMNEKDAREIVAEHNVSTQP